MSGWTKGPWVCEVFVSLQEAKNNHAFNWAGGDGLLRGQRPACVWLDTGTGTTGLPGSIETTEANARLIAAAPELLEALEECERQLEYLDERSPSGTTPAVLSRVRAALAKARGEA